MKISFNLIAKIGLLLVVIGFFMPVACNQTGPEIAKTFMNNNNALGGILMYIMLISAIVGVVLGVLAFNGKSYGANVDWIVIIVCVASGLLVYLLGQNSSNVIFKAFAKSKLDTGGVFILIGWIVAIAAQVMSRMKGES